MEREAERRAEERVSGGDGRRRRQLKRWARARRARREESNRVAQASGLHVSTAAIGRCSGRDEDRAVAWGRAGSQVTERETRGRERERERAAA